MYVKKTTVRQGGGLTARNATLFIQRANTFKSDIWIEKSNTRVNGKSLLGILALEIDEGAAVRIIADGIDEQRAVDSLCAFAAAPAGL